MITVAGDLLRRNMTHKNLLIITYPCLVYVIYAQFLWRTHENMSPCTNSRVWGDTQRAHDVIITSLLRQNDVATSFWRNNDVIITFSVRWVYPRCCSKRSCCIHHDSVTFLRHTYLVRYRYIAVNFLTNIHKRRPIARRLRRGMGVFFDWASDWYSASVPVIIYEISCNIGPRYYCTRPYIRYQYYSQWQTLHAFLLALRYYFII